MSEQISVVVTVSTVTENEYTSSEAPSLTNPGLTHRHAPHWGPCTVSHNEKHSGDKS